MRKQIASLVACAAISCPVLGQAQGTDEKYIIEYLEIELVNGEIKQHITEKKVSLDKLLRELDSAELGIRLNSVRAIQEPEKWPNNHRPMLIWGLGNRLQDKVTLIRYRACEVLSRIGPEAASILPALIESAKDKEPAIRGRAILAIGNVGPQARTAIPVLIKALEDTVPHIAMTAARALGQIGADAVPALVGALDNPNDQMRAHAAIALRMIGVQAQKAIPHLKRLLTDKSTIGTGPGPSHGGHEDYPTAEADRGRHPGFLGFNVLAGGPGKLACAFAKE